MLTYNCLDSFLRAGLNEQRDPGLISAFPFFFGDERAYPCAIGLTSKVNFILTLSHNF